MPTPLLEMTDMRGRTVLLMQETWVFKILPKRPSVVDLFPELIRSAVFQPTFVCTDREHADRRCHYLDLGQNEHGKQRWLKVVIEYQGGVTPRSRGVIVTLHKTQRLKPGEIREWP